MEAARNRKTEISRRKYQQTTIGDLRKLYGVDFAKDCAEKEKVADVVQRRPSFKKLIRYHERKPNRTKCFETTIGDPKEILWLGICQGL
jgi:hypothetical protein